MSSCLAGIGTRSLAFLYPRPCGCPRRFLGCATLEIDIAQHLEMQVWLAGVTVTFEEHLMTVDSDTGELVGALEAQVAAGQFIK